MTVTLISLPMFIAGAVCFIIFLFTLVLYARREIPRLEFVRIFLFLSILNSVFVTTFGILLNLNDTIELINIINRISVIASIFTLIFFFHFVITFFEIKSRKLLYTVYVTGILIALLSLINTEFFLANEIHRTSSYYNGLKYGPLLYVWVLYIFSVLILTAIASLKGYIKARKDKSAQSGFILYISLSSVIWIVSGLSDALTTIKVIDLPPLSWIGSLLIIINLSLLLIDSFDKLTGQVQHLYNQLIHDSLTGCYSKSYLEIEMTRIFSALERKKSINALTLFDIDNFKSINDTYGHLCGDYILREIVAITTRTLRSGDIIARFGGDEFILLFQNLDSQNQVAQILERIRLTVENHSFTYDNNTISITCSYGTTIFNDSIIEINAGVEHIYALSDTALYSSKRNGRNRCEFHYL